VRVNTPISLLSRVTRYSGHVDGRIMSLTGGEVRCVLVPAHRAAVLGREGAGGVKIALFVELYSPNRDSPVSVVSPRHCGDAIQHTAVSR
jgi:hypothetical protein